ncbi:MAG: TraR/DksA C4-type zinc finger protein [Actinomycetota bacterium]|nr:TraR/DksA C4-type zinc finger protein [Actinomycetota bacterium]
MARKLSATTINRLKKKLLKEQEDLSTILEKHQVERENIRLSEASSDRSPDPTTADGGSMAFELEKDLTLDENTKDLLTQVEKALERISKKKYGDCEICEKPIPVNRLDALPYITSCKDCANLKEA